MRYFIPYVLLLLVATPAAAQIQGGPNIAPNGTRFTFSPRFGYLGPPMAFVYGPPPPPAYRVMPIAIVPREPIAPPPPFPFPLPLPPAPPLLPEAPCIVDPSDIGLAPFLNVRTSPNGWIVGQLPNGTPVFPTGEAAGNWVVIAAPIPGWVFRPYLACRPPIDAYAYQPPDTGPPGAPPMRPIERPAVQARPTPPPAPAPRARGQRRPTNFPCPAGCPREPDDL